MMRERNLLLTASMVALVSWVDLAIARPVLAEPTIFEPTRVLYVSSFGDDGADGLTPERAFRTLSATANKTQPGDLVLVRGGVYFERVELRQAGTQERPIVFRAMPGETALVTAAQRPENWERVKDTRHVFAVTFSSVPNYVMDERNLTRYFEAPDRKTLDEAPGSYQYNEDEHVLSVHPMRGLTPEQVAVVVLVSSAQNDTGILVSGAYNRVEGFHIAFHPIGIQLLASSTEAWNNRVYGCTELGIWAREGEGLIVANNVCFLNEGSGLYISNGARGARLVGNVSWGNTETGPYKPPSGYGYHYQLALYGDVTDPIVEGNLLMRGLNPLERGDRLLRYKSACGMVTTLRNVLIGGSGIVTWGDRAVYENNTVVGGDLNIYATRAIVNSENAKETRSVVAGNLYLSQRSEAGFVDPKRFDFRLRADSPHLGSGAWPEAALVRYVSPEGDDNADGGTPTTAWRTLVKAAASAQPSVTIYVMPGEYRESVTLSTQGDSKQPVELLTYGHGQVVLNGGGKARVGITLQGARGVKLDGFVFRGFSGSGVAITGGGEITLENNVFDGLDVAIEATDSTKISIENCTFTACGEGVRGRKVTEQMVLRNNLYVRGSRTLISLDEPSRSTLVSERNAFSGSSARAQLKTWREEIHEGHPSLEVNVDVSAPDYQLPAFSRLNFSGLGHRPLGAREEALDVTPIEVEAFRIAYVAPDRALVEWFTPRDYANATLSWRGGSDVRQVQLDQYQFDTVLRQTRMTQMLVDLKPKTEYNLTLDVSTPDGRQGSVKTQFKTPEAYRAPMTVYVSKRGDDKNDGMSLERPLATLTAATLVSVPGDTILVGPGIYREAVHLMCGGLDAQQRLTLRSERPGEAIVDLGEFRPNAFVVRNVSHVTLDGFRIRGMVYSGSAEGAAVQVLTAEDVEITNFVFESQLGGVTSVSSLLIYGENVRGLCVRNNLFQRGFQSISVAFSDHVIIDHNTFYKGGVNAIQLHGKVDAVFRITNNIFYDVLVPDKVNAAIAINRPTKNLVLSNNLYHRDQAVNMGLLGFLATREGGDVPWSERAGTVEEVFDRFGVGQGDLVADPLFMDAEKGDFRLKPNSPAIGMSEDGRNAGMVTPSSGLNRDEEPK